MPIMPSAGQVRQLVTRLFVELGLRPHHESIVETFVIDHKRHVARSYRLDEHLAMWLIDAGLVVCYDPAGNLVRLVNLREELSPMAIAA